MVRMVMFFCFIRVVLKTAVDRITHEAEVQLNSAMLRLMSTMLATTPFCFGADGAPVVEGHVGQVVLCYRLRDRCCWRPQGCGWKCFHVAVLGGEVAGEDTR